MGGNGQRSVAGGHRIPLPLLLYAFLGAPVAWSVHFLIVYFLVALFCTTGMPGARLVIALATLAFLGASVGAGVVALRKWRERHAGQGWADALAEPGGLTPFLLVMGMLGAALFSLLIALEGAPLLFVPLCPAFSP